MRIEYTKEGPLHWHVALGEVWWNHKTIFGLILRIISWPFHSKAEKEYEKNMLDVLKDD